MLGSSLGDVIAAVQQKDKEQFDRNFRENEEKSRALRGVNGSPGGMTASELLAKLAKDAGYEVDDEDQKKANRKAIAAASADQQEKINARLTGSFPPPPRLPGK